MMPMGALLNIRSVHIYHNGYGVYGFKFFNKHNSLLWEIGFTTDSSLKAENVYLEDNEVIIGVKAKLLPTCQSLYSDFQFLIGRA